MTSQRPPGPLPSAMRRARDLKALELDPVVRYRLLRDVPGLARSSSELARARERLESSVHVRRLAAAQAPDGGWGRFHSMYSDARGEIVTTEAGVSRALAIGLDDGHPVLQRAGDYIERILDGCVPFPDPAERNARWPVGTMLFAAGTLARFRPASPALAAARAYWLEVACASFARGRRDEAAELECHRRLAGARIAELHYLELGSCYAVPLLGSAGTHLPAAVEAAFARWLWRRSARRPGIGYLEVRPDRTPRPGQAALWDRWLASQELMSALPSWPSLFRSVEAEMRSAAGPDGWWDFGSRPAGSPWLPLSESWRRREARKQDWSLRVLTVLARAMNLRRATARR